MDLAGACASVKNDQPVGWDGPKSLVEITASDINRIRLKTYNPVVALEQFLVATALKDK